MAKINNINLNGVHYDIELSESNEPDVLIPASTNSFSTAFNSLFSQIDPNRLTRHSYLKVTNTYYHFVGVVSNSYNFVTTLLSGSSAVVTQAIHVKSSSSEFLGSNTGASSTTFSDYSSNTANSDIEFFYE